MDIADWRTCIDDIDRQLVTLLNQRAQAAHQIGRLKHLANGPVYEPERERAVFANVQAANLSICSVSVRSPLTIPSATVCTN